MPIWEVVRDQLLVPATKVSLSAMQPHFRLTSHIPRVEVHHDVRAMYCEAYVRRLSEHAFAVLF